MQGRPREDASPWRRPAAPARRACARLCPMRRSLRARARADGQAHAANMRPEQGCARRRMGACTGRASRPGRSSDAQPAPRLCRGRARAGHGRGGAAARAREGGGGGEGDMASCMDGWPARAPPDLSPACRCARRPLDAGAAEPRRMRTGAGRGGAGRGGAGRGGVDGVRAAIAPRGSRIPVPTMCRPCTRPFLWDAQCRPGEAARCVLRGGFMRSYIGGKAKLRARG